MKFNAESDAPVLIVLGQSNAYGYGTHLPEEERIITPLTHVYGLARKENQAYGLADVTWSGFTTAGMNLGETQDDTFSLAESFARLWQSDCDNGATLPPLYIVQISIGAQGIAETERDGLNMWYPDRERILMPGNGGEVDISLYPLAIEIISAAMKNLKSADKTPRIVGLHWNQWETEAFTGGESIINAERNYRRLFAGFREAMGMDYPLWLYQPLSRIYCNAAGVQHISQLFEQFQKESDMVHIMRTSTYPSFDEARDDQGIFQEDYVHYLPEVHRWFAQKQYEHLFNDAQQ